MPCSLPTPLNSESKPRAFLCIQKHSGKDQDCRLPLEAGGCHFPLPDAVMPPQRQFQAPCKPSASRHQCWEPWHSLREGAACCSHTGRCLCSQFSSLKAFSFPFPRTCSDLFLGFFHHWSFGVSHSPSLSCTQACTDQ